MTLPRRLQRRRDESGKLAAVFQQILVDVLLDLIFCLQRRKDVDEAEQCAGVVGLEIQHRPVIGDARAHLADQRRIAADLGVETEVADAAAAAGHPQVEAAQREIIEATRFRPLQARTKIFIIDDKSTYGAGIAATAKKAAAKKVAKKAPAKKAAAKKGAKKKKGDEEEEVVAEEPDILDEPEYLHDFIRALAMKKALENHGILYDA